MIESELIRYIGSQGGALILASYLVFRVERRLDKLSERVDRLHNGRKKGR